jgi:tRNA dimethylallyltransferase
MRIGTARPSDEQLRKVRHHFIGHLSVKDYYNVGMFESDALQVLESLFITKSHAVMVGGSGLYIDAVCEGIDKLPDSDLGLREKLKEDFQKFGIAFLQEKLRELDPDYYETVDLQNPARLMRGIEVSLLTGRPYSSYRKNIPAVRDFHIEKYSLDIPRDQLNVRIHDRTDRMIREGLVEEVRSLVPFRELNALNTVGYKEIFDFLDHRCTLEEAVERIKTNTRRYAKRQMTWFRHDPQIKWVKSWDEILKDLAL